jgi:nucleotide-binding universal stress UspA family protein
MGRADLEIVKAARESESDLVIMGNYGYHPMLAIFLGSTVDEVLRTFNGSVLVCR